MFALPLRKLLIFESHVSGYTLEIFQVENFEGVTSEGEADVCIHQNTQNKSAVSYAIGRTANEATPQSSNLEEVKNSIPSQGSSVLYMYTNVSKKPSGYFLLFDTHYTFITYTFITYTFITYTFITYTFLSAIVLNRLIFMLNSINIKVKIYQAYVKNIYS